MLLPGHLESGWLHDVQFLAEITIEECSLDIHVVDRPAFVPGECDHEAHRLEASHGSKDLIIINVEPLHIALCNELGLVLDDLAALVFFHQVNPFEANQVVSSGKIHQLPCPIVINGLHLVKRFLSPAFALLGLGKCGGFVNTSEVHLLCFGNGSGAGIAYVVKGEEAVRRITVITGIQGGHCSARQ